MTMASQLEFAAVCFEKHGKVFAADFFLAFDHERQIAGQGRAGFQIRFDGFQVREELAFVVRAAARKKIAASDARLERRRCPQVERFRRLHVVMAIDDIVRSSGNFFREAFWRPQWDCRRSGRVLPPARSGGNASRSIRRRRANSFCMLRLRGDAGETDEFAQLGHEAGLVLFQVIKDGLHGA